MGNEPTLDLSRLLRDRRLTAATLQVVALCCCITFVDGLEFSSINVAAPAIIKAFSVEKSAMGIVFGAGMVGSFVGAIVFGYIGDRIGRRIGMIVATLAFALPAFLSVYAQSLDQLLVLRFLAGLGIGGVIPNCIAMITETSPNIRRSLLVGIAFACFTLGGAAMGRIAGWVVPAYGWQAVFVAAGGAGFVAAGALILWLPESLRYLALKQPGSEALRKLVARLLPELISSADTIFVFRDEQAAKPRFSLGMLFSGSGSLATPLLWLLFFSESISAIAFIIWLPTILDSAGVANSAVIYSYAMVAAVVLSVVISRSADRFGPIILCVAPLVAIVLACGIGASGLAAAPTLVIVALNGCLLGTHNSINSVVGLFYPTSYRGNGVGWATAMGKAANVVGSVAGGFLLSAKFPLNQIFYLLCAPIAVVAVVTFTLGCIYNARFRQPASTVVFAAGTRAT